LEEQTLGQPEEDSVGLEQRLRSLLRHQLLLEVGCLEAVLSHQQKLQSCQEVEHCLDKLRNHLHNKKHLKQQLHHCLVEEEALELKPRLN